MVLEETKKMIELITYLLITVLWSYAFYMIGYLARRVDEEVEREEFRKKLLEALIAKEKEEQALKENNDGN